MLAQVAAARPRVEAVGLLVHALARRQHGLHVRRHVVLWQVVGARLVEATIEQARARGCAEIGAYLVAATEHNRPFYEKFGFQSVGTEMRQVLA